MTQHICVLIANGFEEIEAITIIDILRRANLKVTITAVESTTCIGSHGISVQCDAQLCEIDSHSVDMLVLPGGVTNTQTLSTNLQAQQFIKSIHEQKKWIGAICAAPIALHTANVLQHKYTCYPSVENYIKNDSLQHLDESVVIDNNIITSQSPATSMLFSLEIVKLLCGQSVHDEVKKGLGAMIE